MEHWEVVFENGEMAVMAVDDPVAAANALKEAHRRAKNGEPRVASDPASGVGPRVKNVWAYDEHPDDLSSTDRVSVDEVRQLIKDMMQDGTLDVNAFKSAVTPQVLDPDAHVHDSKYTAESREQLDPALWEGGD